MDDLAYKHWEMVTAHYPALDVRQLGMACIMLGALRASMGHEHAKNTIECYIHKEHLSQGVRECIDYLEREVLGLKKSKIDIDYWKRGNVGNFRRDKDLVQV